MLNRKGERFTWSVLVVVCKLLGFVIVDCVGVGGFFPPNLVANCTLSIPILFACADPPCLPPPTERRGIIGSREPAIFSLGRAGNWTLVHGVQLQRTGACTKVLFLNRYATAALGKRVWKIVARIVKKKTWLLVNSQTSDFRFTDSRFQGQKLYPEVTSEKTSWNSRISRFGNPAEHVHPLMYIPLCTSPYVHPLLATSKWTGMGEVARGNTVS